MRRAVKAMFAQFKTEKSFGWYHRDGKSRAVWRVLYPVEHVAAHHRREFSPSFFNDHARRMMAFNAGMRS